MIRPQNTLSRWYVFGILLVLTLPGLVPWLVRLGQSAPRHSQRWGRFTHSDIHRQAERLGFVLSPEARLVTSVERSSTTWRRGGERRLWTVYGSDADIRGESDNRDSHLFLITWDADDGRIINLGVNAQIPEQHLERTLSREEAASACRQWLRLAGGLEDDLPRPWHLVQARYSSGTWYLQVSAGDEHAAVIVQDGTGALLSLRRWRPTTAI